MTAVTGTVSSTTGTSVGVSAAHWANPNNIFSSNNAYAVASSSAGTGAGQTTGYLYALANGFSIPSGASIDGISIEIEAKNSIAGTGFRVRPTLSDIFLRYSGADQSPNSPSGVSQDTWSGTTDTTKTFGSATASWSASLTPAIINDSSFGVRVRFINASASTNTLSVDRISITVYYTDAGVQSSQQQILMCEF